MEGSGGGAYKRGREGGGRGKKTAAGKRKHQEEKNWTIKQLSLELMWRWREWSHSLCIPSSVQASLAWTTPLCRSMCVGVCMCHPITALHSPACNTTGWWRRRKDTPCDQHSRCDFHSGIIHFNIPIYCLQWCRGINEGSTQRQDGAKKPNWFFLQHF